MVDLPDIQSTAFIREREVDRTSHQQGKGLIHLDWDVRGEDGDAAVLLHPPEENGRLAIRKAVAGIPHLGPFPEE